MDLDDKTPITVPEGLIRASDVVLAGEDGNAFAIMGRVSRGLKDAGNDQSVIDSYFAQAQSGDYDNLLLVSLMFTGSDND